MLKWEELDVCAIFDVVVELLETDNLSCTSPTISIVVKADESDIAVVRFTVNDIGDRGTHYIPRVLLRFQLGLSSSAGAEPPQSGQSRSPVSTHLN
jgi:hypothetical protein